MLNDNTNDDDIVYLNNAGQARLEKRVQEIGSKRIQMPPWKSNVSEDDRQVRRLFAQLILADESEISIMPSTAFAITLAAKNVELHSSLTGGRVLLLQDQYDSAVYPWQDLCHRSDGRWKLEIVPSPHETDWTEAVLASIHAAHDHENPVRVACLPPLHWSTGALLDLPRISEMCRQLGVLLIVDATQAVGAMPCSIQSIQPAMLACSIHKWLRGPPGASLVYVNTALHNRWQPLDQHGRARDTSGGSSGMGPDGYYPEKFVKSARKFDSGGRSNPILLPMLRASLEEVVQVNVAQLQQRLEILMRPLLEWAKLNDFNVPRSGHAYHLVGIQPRNTTNEKCVDICQQLAAQGVFIAVRCGGFRVSPYLDTTEEHIKRLIDSLTKLLEEEHDV